MREREIFEAALVITDLAKRSEFLEQACASDAELMQHLVGMLEAHEKLGNFLEFAPNRLLDRTAAQPDGSKPGTVIAGRYKLLEAIGEGGMGTVWVAEQTEPVRRKVALKLIKAGMDSKSVLARFAAERQALAMMDHPNIAKVLDGGSTETGRPFFAMEYVKGIAITKYCDDARLSVADRLALFIPVCHAIQHAHQKGIIHRDLKPSNILVCLYDGKPVPKVIDFGLAKAMLHPLTEHTLHTAHGTMMGTPLYMSPEQAEFNNLDVDTRTDIYAMGVILYELLTGTTPLESKRLKNAAWQEMLRLIKDEEPPKPSVRLSNSGSLPSVAAQRQLEPIKLARLMRGELDWIVMKALEKDRARRYETANGFARDIQRYLADEMVEARPPNLAYRLKKVFHRNKAQIVAAGLLFLAMLIGIAGTSWQAFRATRAETEALRERDEKTQAWNKEAGLRQIADTALDDVIQQKAKAITAEKLSASEADRNRRLLYSADVALASQAWQGTEGTVSQCEELLKVHVPKPGQFDLREFCWRYQWGLLRKGSIVRLPPSHRLLGADDRRFLVQDLGAKQSLTLCEFGDRPEPVLMQLGNGNSVKRTISIDGNAVASLDANDSWIIHDTRAGLSLGTIKSPTELASFSLSPDGRYFVGAGRDSFVRVWDVASGKILHTYSLAGPRIPGLDLSADGSLLLAAHVGTAVSLYRAGSPDPVMLVKEHDGFVRYQGVLSRDGKFAAAGHAGNYVEVWETANQTLIGSVRTQSAPYRLAFSPDGGQLAVGEKSGVITLWETSRRQTLRVLKGHSAKIEALAYSSKGNKLVSIDYEGDVRVWEFDGHTEARLLAKDHGEINWLNFSPDGRRLLESGRGHFHLHDLRSKISAKSLAEQGGRVALFMPDGQSIIGALDNCVTFWNAKTGQVEGALPKPNAEIGSMAVSPNGRWVVVGCGSATSFGADHPQKVVVYDTLKRVEHKTFRTPTQVSAVAFSADGTLVAAAGHNGSVRLWNVARWDEIGQWSGPPSTQYGSVIFLPDRKMLAAGAQTGMIDLWDIEEGKVTRRLLGHSDGVSVMSVSPDGRTLATGSWDHSIKLWDTGTYRELRTLRGHTSWIYALAFSPDGNTLASSGVDGVLQLWEAPSLEAVTSELAVSVSFASPPHGAKP